MKLVTFLAYAALLTWVSLTPGGDGGLPLWDKALHFTLYAIFLLMGCHLCQSPQQFLGLACGIFSYGVLMEIGQAFVPGRSASVLDMVANAVGVATAYFAAPAVIPALKKSAPLTSEREVIQ